MTRWEIAPQAGGLLVKPKHLEWRDTTGSTGIGVLFRLRQNLRADHRDLIDESFEALV